MNVNILDFINSNNKIKRKYLCNKQDGDNILPNIRWTVKDNNKIKSFAIIFEDITINFVHLFIPFINKDIREINEIKELSFEKTIKDKSIIDIYKNINKLNMFIGKNYQGKNEYFGPCASKDTGVHTYIFRLYALDNILDFDIINGSSEFNEVLKDRNIKIIEYSEQIFTYSYFYK